MALPYVRQQFKTPVTGDVDERLAQVALKLNQKADIATPATWQFLGLIDPSGRPWKLTIDNSGTIHTALMDRTQP